MTNLIVYATVTYTLGRIPLDPRLSQCLEEGKSYVDNYIGTPAQTAIAEIVQKIVLTVENDKIECDNKVADESVATIAS